MWFIYSSDLFLLKQKINQTIEEINVNQEYEIFNFSLVDDQLNQIINEINNLSFFNNKKIIVIDDCWFVNESKISLNKTFNWLELQKILEKHSDDVKIIMSVNSDKFSKKLKTANWINQNTNLIEVKPYNQQQITEYISQQFFKNNLKINNQAIEYLINNSPENMQIIKNEVNKLILLNKEINVFDVEQNLTKYLDSDIFKLSSYFIENDLNHFLPMFQDYILLNNDLLGFIALLSSNVAFYRNVLLLKNNNNTINQIVEKLDANFYRVKIAFNSNYDNVSKLNDKIKVLYDLNKKMTSSMIDSKVIPEYEFIKIMGEK